MRQLHIYLAVMQAIPKIINRAVARSENPGELVVLGGDNVPPLVEIGLTDLPNTGRGAKPPPQPPRLRQA